MSHSIVETLSILNWQSLFVAFRAIDSHISQSNLKPLASKLAFNRFLSTFLTLSWKIHFVEIGFWFNSKTSFTKRFCILSPFIISLKCPSHWENARYFFGYVYFIALSINIYVKKKIFIPLWLWKLFSNISLCASFFKKLINKKVAFDVSTLTSLCSKSKSVFSIE